MTAELLSYQKVKLRVDDFDLLALNGGLAGLDRTELLDGDIYQMSPQYTRHGRAKALFHEALLDWKRAHRPELLVFSEVSVAMPPYDEPIPDVILCDKQTSIKGIAVETVHLLIEVADESRDRDLGYKKQLYAQQGVPEYWVVDLAKAVVWRFAEPAADGYMQGLKVAFGGQIEAVTLAKFVVDTSELA